MLQHHLINKKEQEISKILYKFYYNIMRMVKVKVKKGPGSLFGWVKLQRSQRYILKRIDVPYR